MGHIDQLLSETLDLSAAAPCILPGVPFWIGTVLGGGVTQPMPGCIGLMNPERPRRMEQGCVLPWKIAPLTASAEISGHGALVAAMIMHGSHATTPREENDHARRIHP
jgi:hypothetical protein